jgi:hypothetical protein
MTALVLIFGRLLSVMKAVAITRPILIVHDRLFVVVALDRGISVHGDTP